MSDFDFLKKAFFRLDELEKIYSSERDGKCNAAAASMEATIRDFLKVIKEPNRDNQ